MAEESELLYQEFLKSFFENEPTPNVDEIEQTDSLNSKPNNTLLSFEDDEDPNDPEYNVFQDIGTLDFDEFLAFYNQIHNNENVSETQNIDTEYTKVNDVKSGLVIETDSNIKEIFTENQLLILNNQLCFHIQTLVQNWILSMTFQNGSLTNEFKQMIFELTQSIPNFMSYVKNLAPTISLIQEQEKQISTDELRCDFTCTLSSKSKKLFSTRKDIFMFDWALPTRRFCSNSKTIFTQGDDYLIALGLEDFHNSKKKHFRMFKYIHERFLPHHSPICIRNHVKNLKRGISGDKEEKNSKRKSKFEEWWSNPIIYYFREKKLLPFNLYFTASNISNVDKLGQPPKWYTQMITKEEKPLCIDEQNINSSKSHSVSQRQKSFLQPKVEVHQINTVVNSGNLMSMFQIPMQANTIFDSLVKRNSNLDIHLEEIKRNTQMYKKRRATLKSKSKKIKHDSNLSKFIEENNHSIINVSIQAESNKIVQEDKFDNNKNLDCNIDSGYDVGVSSIEIPNDQDLEKSRISYDQLEMLDVDENYMENYHENYAAYDEIIYDDPDEDIDDNDIIDEETELISNEKTEYEFNDNLIDDENDLMALMEASWTTVTNRNKDVDGTIPGRRKSDILALQRNSSKYIFKNDFGLNNDNKNNEKSRNELLITYYLKRARKILLENDYVRFLELIACFINNSDSQSSILNQEKTFYHQLKNFLTNLKIKYSSDENLTNRQQILDGLQELTELVIIFLDFFQAQNCGVSFQYLHWKRIFEFFRKVELYLSFIYSKRNQQHSCIQKMVRALNQLVQQSSNNINSEHISKIKATMSKILNNHPLLMKEFSSLFLDEIPAPYLYSNEEDFDDFVLNDEINDVNFELENAFVPINENDLKYGTNDCPCLHCHEYPLPNESNINHCSCCSIRFISGRIYLPQINNKKLQLVEYIKQSEEKKLLKSFDLNQTDINKANIENKQWSLADDRLLLQACRSMIVDLNITKLNKEAVEKIASSLVKEEFQHPRNFEDIVERLLYLIKMLMLTTNVGN